MMWRYGPRYFRERDDQGNAELVRSVPGAAEVAVRESHVIRTAKVTVIAPFLSNTSTDVLTGFFEHS
jgi:hypothetical protein